MDLKSKFGDFSDFFTTFLERKTSSWLLHNNFFSFAFITDTPTNKCLHSDRFVTLIQGCNLQTALSTSLAAYAHYCLLLHSRKAVRKDKGEAEDVGARKDRHELRREKPRRTEEWGRATGKRRESLNRFCGRERGMNIPILPCSLETAASSFGGQHCLCLFPAWLFAWCIPPDLYSVMGERWRSGRLTMRPKGRRGRQRSKATLLYRKLVTVL